METAIRCWGYMGIMQKKMEAIGIILGLYRDYGRENGITRAKQSFNELTAALSCPP